MSDERLQKLTLWLGEHFAQTPFKVHPLKGDASFRRYFRVTTDDQKYVVMDAPPPKEDTRPFVAIAESFLKKKITVPEIKLADTTQGFLLLSDLGDDLYLDHLTPENASTLYHNAFQPLLRIHACEQIENWSLPRLDANSIRKPLTLFEEWFIPHHIKTTLSPTTSQLIEKAFHTLSTAIASQPMACLHRDYHSRNLMLLPNNEVGILDFQDAVWGPITYDIVSLLKDCYIDWPTERVQQWVNEFYYQLKEQHMLNQCSAEQFTDWFHWTGLQRHLRILGTFTRLYVRDNKPQYLQYFPRILNYVYEASEHYPEFKELRKFLQDNTK
jgi:aminoglycoside/choline kinase family phosphotransferase